MKYIIDEDKLYKLIDAEVSLAADQAHDKDGHELFDGIVLTSKDGEWVKRFMHDAAARLVGRMPDIAKFSAVGKKGDEPGIGTYATGAQTSGTSAGTSSNATTNSGKLSAKNAGLLKGKGGTTESDDTSGDNDSGGDTGSSESDSSDMKVLDLPNQYVGDVVTTINLIHIYRRTNEPYLVGRDSFERFTATKTGVKYKELDLDPDGLREIYEEFQFTVDDAEAATFYNNAIYAGRQKFGNFAKNPMVTINYWGTKSDGTKLPWAAIVYITEDDITEMVTSRSTLSFKGVMYRGLTGVEDSQYWASEFYIDGDGNIRAGSAGSSLYANTGSSTLVYRVLTETAPGELSNVKTSEIEHGSLNLGGMEVFSQMSTDLISMQLSPTRVTFGAKFSDPKSEDKVIVVTLEKSLTAESSGTLSWNYKSQNIPSWFNVSASGSQLVIKLAEENASGQRTALLPVVGSYTLPDGRGGDVIQYITVVQESAAEEVKPEILVSVQPDNLFFDAEPSNSQYVLVSIGDGGDYKYAIRYDGDGEVGWINVAKNGDKLTVWCLNNKDANARRGYIDIIPLEGDGTVKATITIDQAGADYPADTKLEFSVTPTTLKTDFYAAALEAYYKVTPGATVEIVGADGEWPEWILTANIPEEGDSGEFGDYINIELEMNEGADAREVDIIVKATLPSLNPNNPPQVATERIHIYQKGNNDDELIPDEPTAEEMSMSFQAWIGEMLNALDPNRYTEAYLKEKSDNIADWEPWTDADWLTVGRDTDAGHAYIYAEAEQNTSAQTRKAAVYVTAYNRDRTKSKVFFVGYVTQDFCPSVTIDEVHGYLFDAIPQGPKDINCVVVGAAKLQQSGIFGSASLIEGNKLRVYMDANTGNARGLQILVTASNSTGETATGSVVVNQKSGSSYSGGGGDSGGGDSGGGDSGGGDSGGGDSGDGGAVEEIGNFYVTKAIDITAPDFDENNIKYVNSNSTTPWHKNGVWDIITRYIVLFSCMRIFEDRYVVLVPTYQERTQAAMDNIINLVRQRKAPSRTVVAA